MFFAKTYFAKALLLSAAMLGCVCLPPLANSAQAGFDFGGKRSSVVRPESDPNAPALQVFEDRYVPDTIKKKYGLSDDWYDEGKMSGQPTNSPAISTPMPLTREEILTPAPTNPDPAEDEMVRDNKTVVVPAPPVLVESWRARKGETVREVLKRWSVRQKTDLLWASTTSPMLEKDFSYVGKFQEAVNKMIAEVGGKDIHSQYRSDGLNPVMMSPASTVTSSTAVPVEKVEKIAKEEPAAGLETLLPLPLEREMQVDQVSDTQSFSHIPTPKGEPETRWFGISGSPLSEVLSVWAEDADVQLIWQCERSFALQETVSQVGLFEDAVFRALSQYDRDSVRPVGEIYKNPQTGQKVLVVRTDSAS